MSVNNKVVWSEGLFLQPQHFQQQDRYFERYVETRCRGLSDHGWGFTELELERDLLTIGKFALRRAAGVFPDGTPFSIPEDDLLPIQLDVGDAVRDQTVYLGVPLRRSDSVETDRGGVDELGRRQPRELETRDATSVSGSAARLEVGPLRTRFLLASDVTQAYACIPVAHIIECRADKHVLLDDRFIPTVMHVRASERLATFMSELLGLLHQRGDDLAGRAASTDRGGTVEIADALKLMSINRHEPVVAHCAQTLGLHPEHFFSICLSMVGELSTLTTLSKRPPSLASYRHERLRESFDPLIVAVRQVLTHVGDPTAVRIPIEDPRFGIRVASVGDRTLFTDAVFVLGAKADMAAEDLRRRFRVQTRIGSVERIRDLVKLSLPGVPIHAVAAAPRQIPFHTGFSYFELDASSELWGQIKTGGVIAMQVAGDFPNLELELWAIRT